MVKKNEVRRLFETGAVKGYLPSDMAAMEIHINNMGNYTGAVFIDPIKKETGKPMPVLNLDALYESVKNSEDIIEAGVRSAGIVQDFLKNTYVPNKFNVMFTDYLKEQLSGGEKTAEDLINLTDGKTTIISIPDASLDIMKNALTEVNVNFAELADLVPDDGEKQLRIASVDLNTAKQCYEAYRHSLMKNKPEEAAAEMKVFSEDDYIDTARETTEQYMQNVMSDEMKERFKQYEGLDAAEMEKEIMKWDCVIKDSKGFECQALRANMAYSELSIDKATLVDSNSINSQLARKFPNYFFATIPGTSGKQIVMLPKNQVFEVDGEAKDRYIAFVNNQKKVRIYNVDGSKLDFDIGETYPTGKDLFKKFDTHKKNSMYKDMTKSAVQEFEHIVPKAAPVR